MPPRIPQPEDFDRLKPGLHVGLVYPDVLETTTAILLLFHGLGDSEAPFAAFARNLALPGVLCLAVRGVSPLPPALVEPDPAAAAASSPSRHFHWGDDLTLAPATGDLDPDPGFAAAQDRVLGRLVRDTLVGACGWEPADVLLFGFGQGASLALGLAAQLPRVVDVGGGGGDGDGTAAFKGAVSVGGPLPPSMRPPAGAKARTPVLICHGRRSELVDADAVELLREAFVDVREVEWPKADDGMPRNREEMLPVMRFLAERLRSAW